MANVIGTNASETINGADGVTNGADMIYGLGGNDLIHGLGGNDTIKGGGGADTIFGGAGFDMINYTDSSEGVVVSLADGTGSGGTAEGDVIDEVEHVTGSYYDDGLIGDAFGNILDGWHGNDVLKGGGGNDVLYAGNGNDWLQGGTGADYLEGGAGIDTADYSNASGAVNVHLSDGVGAWNDAAGDQLEGIENLNGSAFNDELWGDANDNVLRGGGGNDDLQGAQGNDTLQGGSGVDVLDGSTGNDILDGGSGADMLDGGLDNDTYYVDSAADTIDEHAGEGADTLHASTTYALAAGVQVETMIAAPGAQLVDLAGNELVQTLIGNDGVNVLSGMGGGDTMAGEGGDDHLFGGAGADWQAGGTGNDTFVFAPSEANGDAVFDFEGNGAAAGDVLIFTGYGAGATFTQVDATHWQVNYNGGASHDVITFLNGASIHASDYAFV